MQQIQKIIEQLGYTPKEVRVYLASLSLGECHVSDIAKKLKMPRTSVQFIVNKLHKDGLMNFYVQRRYKYWVPEKPKQLLTNLRKKEALMEEVLPRINLLRKKEGESKYIDPSESLSFFRVVADTAFQPVLVTDEYEVIQYVNSAWEEQFGYFLKEVQGKTPRIIKSDKTPKEIYKEMWGSLKIKQMFQSDKIIDKKKDGTLFNLLTTIFPVAHNGFLFYVQILDDLTEKKRIEILQQKFIQHTD